jgi:hypothetical protein
MPEFENGKQLGHRSQSKKLNYCLYTLSATKQCLKIQCATDLFNSKKQIKI